MTLANYKILVLFVATALVGVISIQAVLFANALEVRQARFKSEVMQALQATGERLEALEAMSVVAGQFQPWLSTQLPQVFAADSVREISLLDQPRKSHIWDSIGYYTFRIQSDTTYYAPEGPTRVEVLTEGAGRRTRDGRKKIDRAQMQRVEQRVMRMDTVLQSFVRSSVSNYRPIEERFTRAEVDSIVRSELERHGLETPYHFAIAEGDFLTRLRSDDYTAELESFRIPIFRNDLLGRSKFLMVQFPDSDGYIYRSMWLMFLLSLVFTTGVVLTFWKTLQQLLKQKKISSIKSDFINNMTHEFKTPLATINLAVDALNSPRVADNPAKREHYARIIRQENLRMHNQVEHVLRMSLLDKDEIDLNISSTPVMELIEQAVSHLELSVIERGGEIRLNVDDDLPGIRVDVHHFTNVLVNILENALKYSEKPPHIVVRVRAVSEIKLPEKSKSGQRFTQDAVQGIEISISDNGIGMTREVAERVFDRFYRAERGNVHTVKGHGLGLAYAREIVEMHGGSIDVESKAGVGSTFRIRLPLRGE